MTLLHKLFVSAYVHAVGLKMASPTPSLHCAFQFQIPLATLVGKPACAHREMTAVSNERIAAWLGRHAFRSSNRVKRAAFSESHPPTAVSGLASWLTGS
jgi:hypothetical protein